MVWMARRPRPLIERSKLDAYHDFVTACFGRRGRTVGRGLRSYFTGRQVRRLGRTLSFDPAVPPSSLSFDQWLGLFSIPFVESVTALDVEPRRTSAESLDSGPIGLLVTARLEVADEVQRALKVQSPLDRELVSVVVEAVDAPPGRGFVRGRR